MSISRQKFDQITKGVDYNHLYSNQIMVVMNIGHSTEITHTTFHRLDTLDKIDTSILVNGRSFAIHTQKQLKDIIAIRKVHGDTLEMVNRIEQYMLNCK